MIPIGFRKYEIKDLPSSGAEDCSYVYIASSAGISKIGCSKNPMARIKAIQGHTGLKFSEIYVSEPHIEAFKSELKVHELIRKNRLCGEYQGRQKGQRTQLDQAPYARNRS